MLVPCRFDHPVKQPIHFMRGFSVGAKTDDTAETCSVALYPLTTGVGVVEFAA